MIQTSKKQIRILSIAPTTRGFGFAVLDGETLADRGVKTVTGDKNAKSLTKVEALLAHYQPGVLVLQDASAKHSRRAPRIRELTRRITALAAARKLKVKLFSREKVMRQFFAGEEGTKHALAELLAKRFPEDLSAYVPPKRQPWNSEDYWMVIFDAVALALLSGLKNRKRPAEKLMRPGTEAENSHEILPSYS
jgi:hypothetical protein